MCDVLKGNGNSQSEDRCKLIKEIVGFFSKAKLNTRNFELKQTKQAKISFPDFPRTVITERIIDGAA